jgi:hydrogenase nickel incorporation protein HypA/HybF
MHEMSIATELMRQLEALAAEHGAARITEVEVAAGELRGVVPEALELAWRGVCEGTVAAGASLKLTVTPAEARCRACGRTFRPEVDRYVCDDCNEADVDLLAGNDIVLTSVSIDQQPPTP